MTDELKKAIEVVSVHARAQVKGLYHASEKVERALALIESALTTDKTLEIVKNERVRAQVAHDSVDSYIENWEKSCYSAKVEVCDDIIREATK
jgi:hypothetical protein